MNYYKTIYDTIYAQVLDFRKFRLVEDYDMMERVFVLFLRRPGHPIIDDGYRVYGTVRVAGPTIHYISEHYRPSPNLEYPYETEAVPPLEERRADFFKNLNFMVVIACEDMIAAALPYIGDGCVEISNNPDGPWINLMPE